VLIWSGSLKGCAAQRSCWKLLNRCTRSCRGRCKRLRSTRRRCGDRKRHRLKILELSTVPQHAAAADIASGATEPGAAVATGRPAAGGGAAGVPPRVRHCTARHRRRPGQGKVLGSGSVGERSVSESAISARSTCLHPPDTMLHAFLTVVHHNQGSGPFAAIHNLSVIAAILLASGHPPNPADPHTQSRLSDHAVHPRWQVLHHRGPALGSGHVPLRVWAPRAEPPAVACRAASAAGSIAAGGGSPARQSAAGSCSVS